MHRKEVKVKSIIPRIRVRYLYKSLSLTPNTLTKFAYSLDSFTGPSERIVVAET